ncbi:vWA domain-containing protein [Tropicibacter naphthalenivorans]|uniref:Ro sixty-related protein n=1 Tax=Tropicibacter naphthalenivorans TaxID=441103 RepID=A0A0N7M0K6_9RHOB|nr:RNA-binding protein [Tropicibacter naphthalenivorans]CUH80729.1 Ro sixty-related protein [Tropicibacter naphthalenivorans]SMC89748.1 SS-A/Ro ribonucleoprotein [Tropicibacter naphthalenivorans]
MANASLFASLKAVLPTTTRNAAGGAAYALSDAEALAQMAVTGTFGGMFYTQPQQELAQVLKLAEAVSPQMLAQTAIYARESGYMKDMPAVLLAVLARRDPALFRKAFARVVDNGKMLRSFVQVVRSGQTGRRSLGSAPKAMVQNWLNGASDWALLNARIGGNPTLADVIKMVHPKPQTPEREALFAWIVGRPCEAALLPQAVQDWLAFRETGQGEVPDVPFQMLTQLPLTPEQWGQVARNGSWQMVRQGLNMLLRNGAFADPEVVVRVADLLRNPEAIAKARAFPYQLMVAAQNISPEMPVPIVEALYEAMEHAVANVPSVPGRVVVCPDVSGSMLCPVTGYRRGASTAVRCVDVAALVAAAVLRANRGAHVLPFEVRVREASLRAQDTVLTNAERLAALAGGGTNCAAPLRWLNDRGEAPDLVVMVSDNESWLGGDFGNQGTPALREWDVLKRRNPRARLVCLDIAPYATTQVPSRPDVLNIGGFSDVVWDQIAMFAKGQSGGADWLARIGSIEV